jgi:hypothetical protein
MRRSVASSELLLVKEEVVGLTRFWWLKAAN